MNTIAEKLKTTYLGLAGLTTSIRQLLSVGAKEVTSQEILEEVQNIDIDTTELAKESTSQEILERVSGIKGDNPDATMTKVSQDIGLLPNKLIKALEDKYTFPVSYDGIVSSTPITSFLEGVINKTSITEISDDKTTKVSTTWSSLGLTNCKKVRLKNCSGLANLCFNGANLNELILDNYTTLCYQVFRGCGLKKLGIPMVTTGGSDASACFMENPNLIDIVAGYNFNGSVSIFASPANVSNDPSWSWYPTNAVTDANNLVEDKIDEFGRDIDTNKKQLLFNIRRHIAANMKQLTTEGYTIRFSSIIKEAILSDPMTADAFTNKGWTIA